MNTINSLLTAFTELLLKPFTSLPALVPLLFWSIIMGILMALVFRYTSNQKALRATADRTRGHLLAIKLFKEDLGVSFWCMVALLKTTGMRMLHSLPPAVVLCLPFVFILTQLALRYEFRPLAPGEAVVVELELSASHWQAHQDVAIEAPQGVAVETPPLRDEAAHTVAWRIRPDTALPTYLRWPLGDGGVKKALAVAADPARLHAVNVRRPGAGWIDRLLYPGEPGFGSNSIVRSITIHHPKRTTPLFGVNIPWWATFLIVSMVAAVLARPWLKVQF